MSLNAGFYLSSFALLAGVIGGAYFFAEWLRHKKTKTFLLFWALALFFLFIFQIPSILAGAGYKIVLPNIDWFFAIAFPLSFFGIMMAYFGIRSMMGPVPKRSYAGFSAWLLASVAYFVYYFWLTGAEFASHLPLYGTILLFFLPIHLLNLALLWKFGKLTLNRIGTGRYKLGFMAIVASILCGLIRNLIILYGLYSYPPNFWFFALQPNILFIFQILGSMFLLAGFLLIHKDYLKSSFPNEA